MLLGGEGRAARLPAERGRPVAVVAAVARRGEAAVGPGAALVKGVEQMWKDVHLRDRGCGGVAVRV